MTLSLYAYPNCNSCKKAEKWLNSHNLTYNYIHIVEDTPTDEELLNMIKKSELPGKKFFNTSGKVYRERNLKNVVKDATIEEMAKLLASDGMLIKRPIITDSKNVTVGFNEQTLEETWL